MSARMSQDDDGESLYTVERNNNNEITALTISTKFARKPWKVRPYDTVMLEASADYKFLGYIRGFVDKNTNSDDDDEEKEEKEKHDRGEDAGEDCDVGLKVCWFYRASDVARQVDKSRLSDLVVCKATHKFQDEGRMKEIFLSNHLDMKSIPCNTLMHPVQVWFLQSSLTPVIVPEDSSRCEAGEGAAAAVAGASGPAVEQELLPGFICRRYFDIDKKTIIPLNRISGKNPKIPEWVLKDLDELIQQSEVKRKAFMGEWTRRLRTGVSPTGAS